MAVIFQSFESGVLIIKESGRVGATDAQAFEQIIDQYATTSPVPIVLLIDAREVSVVTPDASRIFVRTASLPNIKLHVVATKGLVVTQAANILALRNPRKNTVVFEDWQYAVDYAYEHASGAAYS
jgi:hypothetical protein